ncbi:type II toxin-antitoxin system PemK/MazF family toxin [Methylorubrum populi]
MPTSDRPTGATAGQPDGVPPAGTVIVVPFPCADRLAEKRRPAVVVSGPSVHATGFVWLAMITSARNPAMAGDLPITDLAEAGLTVPSVIRPVKIACVEPSCILRSIGALPDAVASELYRRIRAHVGTH